ncbi:MAG TPA: thioesterase family protein [Anaerolineales bacterium]
MKRGAHVGDLSGFTPPACRFQGYNFHMPGFRYFHPIEVRYGDLDPQGHVNNARYLTYLEQARIGYISQLGLFDGTSWLDVGFILADVHLTFRASILFGQPVRVGACVSRLGNKSLTMEYRIEDAQDSLELATATAVLVTYDYRSSRSIPIPDRWRQVIGRFEGLS